MLRVRWHAQRLAVCRLDSRDAIPSWFEAGASASPVASIVRTADELSVIVAADSVPESVVAERDFVACEVVGPLDFALVGVLKRLVGPLADAGIPVLAISTHDTDWLLIRAGDAERAADVLGTVALLENHPPRGVRRPDSEP